MVDIDELKAKNSIMSVAFRLGFNVNPNATSGTKAVRCFAHEDKKTPSLVLMADVNYFECKVCADLKGDCIALVRKFKNLDFEEACKWIDESCVVDKDQKPKPINPHEYLANRGLKPETIEKFGLRVDKYYGKENCIAIPLPTGEKYRLLEGDGRYRHKPGTSACLFKTLEAKDKVIVTEGEFDAMIVYQETGYPAWSGTTGKGTFHEDWVKDFEGFNKIFLAYDNDEAGRIGARKVAKILGVERCFFVEVPATIGKDWTDYFTSHKTKEDFNELLKNAKPFRKTLLERFNQSKKPMGKKIQLGYRSIDIHTSQEYTMGNTYLLAGLEKSGKSALLLNFLNNMLLDNEKVVYIDTELGMEEFSRRMAGVYNNLTGAEVEARIRNGDRIDREWIELFDGHFFYYGIDDPEEIVADGILSFQKILSRIKESDANVVMIDNLTKFASQPGKGQAGWESLALAIDKVINYTKEAQVVTFIVVHIKESVVFSETPAGIMSMLEDEDPRKIFKKSATVVRRPTLGDVFGGGAAHSQLSGSFLLWRPYQKFNNPEFQKLTHLILESFRHSASGVDVELLFDGQKGIFYEVDVYGNPLMPDDYPSQTTLDQLQEEKEGLDENFKYEEIE